MSKSVRITVDEGVAVIELNRPEARNTIDRAMIDALLAAFDRVDADDEVRAAVLTASGPVFCAGADLSAGAGVFNFGGDVDAFRDPGGLITLRAYRSLKPLVAAIGGAAVGLGATMLLPFDLRIASSAAKFMFPFTQRGITPESASSWFLPRLVGPATAIDWLVSGRTIEADEALAAGLIQQIVDPAGLLDLAVARARTLVQGTAPVSVAITRQLVWRMLGATSPEDAHLADSRALFGRGTSGDAMEGITAFLQKRTPSFPQQVSTDFPQNVFAAVAR